jgi:alpha-galactosidase
MENKHVQNYLRFWDALIERNPGMWIDSCSSGGRRNDLETMRRAVSLHYTDIGYGNHPIKQKQHREMFEWMPYFRAHTMSWDRHGVYCDWDMQPADKFAFHCAMAPAITELIEYYDNDEMFEVGREMTPIWRRAAELMISGDYYPLTECRKSPEDYYAMQFDDPAEKKGFLQVIRNIQCAEDSFTVMPFAEENETYEFEDMETGEKFTLSGKDFAKGYTVNLPKRTGRIWFYKRG